MRLAVPHLVSSPAVLVLAPRRVICGGGVRHHTDGYETTTDTTPRLSRKRATGRGYWVQCTPHLISMRNTESCGS